MDQLPVQPNGYNIRNGALTVTSTRIVLIIAAISQSITAFANETAKLYKMTDLSWAVEPGFLFPPTPIIRALPLARGCKSSDSCQVRMPTWRWNGRIMFSTVGGGAGSIGTPSLLNRIFMAS